MRLYDQKGKFNWLEIRRIWRKVFNDVPITVNKVHDLFRMVDSCIVKEKNTMRPREWSCEWKLR